MKTNNKFVCCATFGVIVSLYAVQPIQAEANTRRPIPPQTLALQREAAELTRQAAVALHAGNYAEAEDRVREAINLPVINAGISQELLAAILEAEGKDNEALQAYQNIVKGNDIAPRNLLPYAQLLLKSGQWEAAVSAYNQALILLPDSKIVEANSHFSASMPDPKGLAVAIHIGRGLIYDSQSSRAGEPQTMEAMSQFDQALRLAPALPLANYYYGYGWQNLSPAERAKLATKPGQREAVKASLEKAAKLGTPDVSAAKGQLQQLR